MKRPSSPEAMAAPMKLPHLDKQEDKVRSRRDYQNNVKEQTCKTTYHQRGMPLSGGAAPTMFFNQVDYRVLLVRSANAAIDPLQNQTAI